MQVKSSGRTPRGGMLSHPVVPRGLPKHGRSVSPSEGQNKTKLGKLQPARSIISLKNTKANNQQISQPNPLHESSDVAAKMSSALQNVDSSSEMPMEVLNKMLPESTVGNINTTEGHLTGMNDINLGTTQITGTVDISMVEVSSEIKSIRATPTHEERDSNSTNNVENSSSEIVGKDSTHGESNHSKAESPVLVSNDVGMHISHMCYTENKEVLDISMDKMNPEGNNAKHSENSIDTLTVGDHNPSVSNAAEIDCLSSQLGVMDINSETRKKFNSYSLSFSQSDVSFQDNPNGFELSSGEELLDCSKKEESLNGPNTPSLYIPAYTRRPFAVKDSFCNMDGLFSVSTESTIAEVKPTNPSLPESMMKENN